MTESEPREAGGAEAGGATVGGRPPINIQLCPYSLVGLMLLIVFVGVVVFVYRINPQALDIWWGLR